MTSVSKYAYEAGREKAKLAFFGELYAKHVKGDLGLWLGGALTGNPLQAGLAGAVGQALDTPHGKSKILQSLGVAGGAAAANSVVRPIVSAIVDATVSAAGISPMSQTSRILVQAIKDIPTGLAQFYTSEKTRNVATHVETLFKRKGTTIP